RVKCGEIGKIIKNLEELNTNLTNLMSNSDKRAKIYEVIGEHLKEYHKKGSLSNQKYKEVIEKLKTVGISIAEGNEFLVRQVLDVICSIEAREYFNKIKDIASKLYDEGAGEFSLQNVDLTGEKVVVDYSSVAEGIRIDLLKTVLGISFESIVNSLSKDLQNKVNEKRNAKEVKELVKKLSDVLPNVDKNTLETIICLAILEKDTPINLKDNSYNELLVNISELITISADKMELDINKSNEILLTFALNNINNNNKLKGQLVALIGEISSNANLKKKVDSIKLSKGFKKIVENLKEKMPDVDSEIFENLVALSILETRGETANIKGEKYKNVLELVKKISGELKSSVTAEYLSDIARSRESEDRNRYPDQPL
ncbi:MAG: hypothetical protein SNJ64_06575, partial [Endomicrobiia bacterium]